MLAAAAGVSAVLAAGTAAAVASTTAATPGARARTMAAVGSKAAGEWQGHAAIIAAVARELHVSTARVSAALRPLFAAGRADTSSPVLAAAARALGVTAQQLNTALVHAKQSLAPAMYVGQRPRGAKAAGSGSAGERQAHDAMTVAVARELHVSTARVSAALRPLFAAGRADTLSPVLAAAARALGVSAQQLNTALVHAKLSLAAGS
jgi:hypothetical protein